MTSIIICSRKSEVSLELKESISSTIGVDFEIVVIDNSHNKYSIFEAYNLGAKRATNPYLCFIHEDIITSSSTDNIKFAINSIEWLADNSGLIQLRNKYTVLSFLEPVSEFHKELLKYLNFFLLY